MSADPHPTPEALALAAPFPMAEIHWKPASVSGNRAAVVAYIDVRTICDRLDAVLGVAGWQDTYQDLGQGAVVCSLSCKVLGEWVTKQDVGGQPKRAAEGGPMKAAFSDALKRAAAKFGIGRYLHRLPPFWVDYDPEKKQVKSQPKLPEWALPPPATDWLTPEQKATLDRLLGQAGADRLAFFAWAGAPSLDQFPASQYERAVSFLQRKKGEKAVAAGGALKPAGQLAGAARP